MSDVTELYDNRGPTPHAKRLNEIAEARSDRMEVYQPLPGNDITRFPWRRTREAFSELYRYIRLWVRVLPCKFWWHSAEPGRIPCGGIRICRRCGAWREG